MTAAEFWALGDYHRISQVIADLGEDLVAEAGIAPGAEVLDVGAGTGNATLPAARRGARVTAVDPCSALLARGAREATATGLTIRWIEGYAEALPFPDAQFDVVLSCVGAMFAADQQTAARELVRVCRPGGLIVMANWTPGGAVGDFFRILARFDPPPPGAPSPLAWGDLDSARRLLGGCCAVDGELRSVVPRFDGTPEEFVNLYRACFPPVIAAYQAQREDPVQSQALTAALTDFSRRELDCAAGPGHGFAYLLLRARRDESPEPARSRHLDATSELP